MFSIPHPLYSFRRVNWPGFSEQLDKCLGWIPPTREIFGNSTKGLSKGVYSRLESNQLISITVVPCFRRNLDYKCSGLQEKFSWFKIDLV